MGESRPCSAAGNLAVYRITQEALTNARKHGDGGPVPGVRGNLAADGAPIPVGDPPAGGELGSARVGRGQEFLRNARPDGQEPIIDSQADGLAAEPRAVGHGGLTRADELADHGERATGGSAGTAPTEVGRAA